MKLPKIADDGMFVSLVFMWSVILVIGFAEKAYDKRQSRLNGEKLDATYQAMLRYCGLIVDDGIRDKNGKRWFVTYVPDSVCLKLEEYEASK